ncbi:serine/threonine-protein phosphatase 6 regulatory subunit [Achlya hypogyna]|uniref:Serine/threonine-protein phosphatase 6 regulatory subunit n=1 Tax=Achlya hypogyna TaxID=1202772 RepID=A0A1V9ZJL5_ACHHY|nr:serine/threonine-protein phosphatase 6 regulatory subunit [Achlya hypogyna]
MSFFASDDSGSVWSKAATLFNISSPLADLLDRDDFTLEQVLEEDELIQEVKTRNVKLLQFLSTEESVRKMVYYITRTPEEGDSDLKAIKYPFMSCEVLCCDIMCITETLSTAKDGAITEDLFKLLEKPSPLDSRLAGYFEKVFPLVDSRNSSSTQVMSLLMIRKPQEMTTLLNKNSDALLQGFMLHTLSFSIAEMFKRLMQPYHSDFLEDVDFTQPYATNNWYSSNDDDSIMGTPEAKKTLLWQTDRRVIDYLVANLKPTKDIDGVAVPIDSDVHKHTAEILADIIHYGSRSSSDSSAPPSMTLVEHIETKEVIDAILDLALPNATPVMSSMTSALTVLSALLTRHANAHYSSSTPENVSVVISATVERLPQICKALKDDAGTLVNTKHETVPRLGLRRLKLVGLLVLLMQAKYRAIDAVILAENAICTCLDLFFQFEAVNMLHAEIDSMVIGILASGGSDLQVGLLKQSNLLGRIMQAYEENSEVTNGNAKGYMGHLLRISNMITNVTDEVRGTDARGSLNDMTHADSVVDHLESDPLWPKWETFVKTTLAAINEKEAQPLGGAIMSQHDDDSYGMMHFDNQFTSSHFADMMMEHGHSHSFDADFDLPHDHDPPAMIHDSSSSDDEEDFTEFDPRAAYGLQSGIPVLSSDDDDDGISADATASHTLNDASWANFDTLQVADSSLPAVETFASFDDATPPPGPAST